MGDPDSDKRLVGKRVNCEHANVVECSGLDLGGVYTFDE